MAYLPELPEWTDGVYQLEKSDPVRGGVDGPANRPLIDLLKRTAWLKQRYEEAFSGLGWAELGEWAVGLEVKTPSQIVHYQGYWYRYGGSLPHTITGASPSLDDNDNWFNLGNDVSLRANLGSGDGFGLVGQVASFTALRSVVPSYEGQSILLRAHPVGWAAMSHGPVGGGEFISRKGTAVDDGGYICVPTEQTEYYWQRIPKNPGKVCATEFGLYDGAVLDDILSNSINYCIKNSLGYLSVPALGPAGYTLAGGLGFVNGTNMLIIEGPGMANKGTSPVITHTGANIGLTFKRNSQAQSLLNGVILKNFTVVGNALATAFVRFSDFYGGSVFDSVVRDYTIGTAIDVYNDKGWTEVIRVDNVMVRTSRRGIWFHSNPASTDWQTVSFYGAKISNFAFQHGITTASEGIYVGDGTRADNLYNCDIDMMGWWEGGGNSTAIYVADKARVDGAANFRYDGFAASAMSSTTQPTRLIRKAGTTGYIKLNCKNYKHQAGIGLTAGVTSLTIRPWLALAESVANIATPHPTLPGEHIITAPGLKCKLTGNIIQGQDSIVQVRSLPAWHRYKVTLRSGLSSTAQQQYIVNTHSDNCAGTVTRIDSVSAATTNLVAGTSNYSTTLSNKNFNPIYLRNAGGLPDNTYSESYRRGFDLVLNGTSALVTEALVPISMEIEAID
ncbi:hypothetical protein [Klebsiella pneumoniae]|uniref:hypothetical protein n=2 Tax=Klebsiella TaxID=570 RepID=UPI0015E56036|nr:hypothetical protein [Klebsiella pneumoniae]QLO57877.1 hypothetical protein HV239_10565 [Klebsiella pneumoniae]